MVESVGDTTHMYDGVKVLSQKQVRPSPNLTTDHEGKTLDTDVCGRCGPVLVSISQVKVFGNGVEAGETADEVIACDP